MHSLNSTSWCHFIFSLRKSAPAIFALVLRKRAPANCNVSVRLLCEGPSSSSKSCFVSIYYTFQNNFCDTAEKKLTQHFSFAFKRLLVTNLLKMAESSYQYQETFVALQQTLFTFPIFPVLWTAHCVLQCFSLRATLNGNKGNALNFARQNPLSCFLLTIFYTFPGGILGCLLSSEPPLAVLANTNQVLVMTLSWYLVFYCPRDLFEKFISGCFLRTPLCMMQDFQRLHLVIIGISKVLKSHPGTLLYPVVFATCYSSGFMFLKAT